MFEMLCLDSRSTQCCLGDPVNQEGSVVPKEHKSTGSRFKLSRVQDQNAGPLLQNYFPKCLILHCDLHIYKCPCIQKNSISGQFIIEKFF